MIRCEVSGLRALTEQGAGLVPWTGGAPRLRAGDSCAVWRNEWTCPRRRLVTLKGTREMGSLVSEVDNCLSLNSRVITQQTPT